jgi:type IV pilus assembly protein PilF
MEDKTGELGEVDKSKKGAGDTYMQIAAHFLEQGQLDLALINAKTSLEKEPDNAQAHNIIALTYQRLGEQKLADSHFKSAIRLQPKNSFIRNAYGAFLCAQDRFEEADQQFNKALENPLYNTPWVALTNAGICTGRAGDLRQSEVYLRSALRTNPRFSAALLEMAKVSLQNGEYLSGRGYLQRYQAVAEHTAESLWVGIQIERQLGDQNAVASYSLMLNSGFPDAEETQLLRESNKR